MVTEGSLGPTPTLTIPVIEDHVDPIKVRGGSSSARKHTRVRS